MFLGLIPQVFDTVRDTLKFTVTVRTNFTIRKFGNESTIYLVVSGSKERIRLSMDFKIPTKLWNEEKKRVKEVDQKMKDINLLLNQIDSKINTIIMNYRFQEKKLLPSQLVKELKNSATRYSFLSFFNEALKYERKNLKPGSYKRHLSVYHKLCLFRKEITFEDINIDFFKQYKSWCRDQDNALTTIASNIASIKKFLKIAQKEGIKLNFDLDDVVAGSSRGNRTPLSLEETKKFYRYYTSEFCSETDKLTLGYFLFSCMTGIRISDVKAMKRSSIIDNYVTFVSQKTNTDQLISLNNLAEKIIDHTPLLFNKHVAEQTMNKNLKRLAKAMNIKKKVTYHTSRHTFATLYLIAGGKIQNLMLLLGHKKIETTMIYSHIVAVDANEDMKKLDVLFEKKEVN